MFCKKCNFKLNNDSNFCENCGTKVIEEIDNNIQNKEKTNIDSVNTSGKGIIQDENGGIRWIYEFSFWKNPAILITTWKVFLLSSGVPALLMFIITMIEDGIIEAFKVSFMVFGICAGIITGLMFIAYPIVAIINGGKYCVLFKMDKNGVDHIQLKKQFKKAQALGLLTAIIGIAGENPSVAGASLLSATKQNLYTTFSKVKYVKINKKQNTIFLNETLTRNQIYASKGDFDFVKDYVLKHCPKKAKISNG